MAKQKNGKQVFQVTDEVRVVQNDVLNVTVERLVDVNRADGTQDKDWKFVGYASSLRSALSLIVHQEILVDTDELKDVEDAVKAIEDSNAKVMSFIEKHLQGGKA